jgi:hypothetical protein
MGHDDDVGSRAGRASRLLLRLTGFGAKTGSCSVSIVEHALTGLMTCDFQIPRGINVKSRKPR